MPRVTDKEAAERDAAAEDLVLAGWDRKGALELCKRFGVAERTVREWRERARERIRTRGLPGATTSATLEDALERLEILWERSLKDGDLRTARAVLWDRARLLDLQPRTRVDVGGNVTIDVTSRRRVDVSMFPAALLEAIARGVSDDELDQLLVVGSDDEIAGVIETTAEVVEEEDGA